MHDNSASYLVCKAQSTEVISHLQGATQVIKHADPDSPLMTHTLHIWGAFGEMKVNELGRQTLEKQNGWQYAEYVKICIMTFMLKGQSHWIKQPQILRKKNGIAAFWQARACVNNLPSMQANQTQHNSICIAQSRSLPTIHSLNLIWQFKLFHDATTLKHNNKQKSFKMMHMGTTQQVLPASSPV